MQLASFQQVDEKPFAIHISNVIYMIKTKKIKLGHNHYITRVPESTTDLIFILAIMCILSFSCNYKVQPLPRGQIISKKIIYI